MSPSKAPFAASSPIYRIDKFIVPGAALDAFVTQTRRVQRALAVLPGCGVNQVLTKTAGPGEFNVVTIVEWSDPAALGEARAQIQAHYAREGFDPQAFMDGLGVRADLGLYAEVG